MKRFFWTVLQLDGTYHGECDTYQSMLALLRHMRRVNKGSGRKFYPGRYENGIKIILSPKQIKGA